MVDLHDAGLYVVGDESMMSSELKDGLIVVLTQRLNATKGAIDTHLANLVEEKNYMFDKK